MNKNDGNFLYWAPRVAGIVLILFISLFSFDVFEGPAPWWEKMLAFLIHLAPSIVLAIGLAIAWRREWFGAVLCVGFGLWYVLMFGTRQHWSASLLLGGLPAAVGLLWWLAWARRGQIHPPA